MKEALKGIEADLTRLREDREEFEREHERRVQQLEDEFGRKYEALDALTMALDEARQVLLSVNGVPPEVQAEREALAHELAQVPDTPIPPAPRKRSKKVIEAASRIEKRLRTVEAATELELGEAAGLAGRGAHSTREAALRLLVEEQKVIVANGTSSDGWPLYTLTG
jgi:seryl-tRNA synthetase